MVLQQLLTSQFLYSQHKFCYHGNYTEAQIHPIFTIRLHFTQKVVGELPFLLHQNCLHIKEHFLKKVQKNSVKRFLLYLKYYKILRWRQNLLTEFFLNFLKKCPLMCKQFWCNKKGSSPTTFCVKCSWILEIGCIWGPVRLPWQPKGQWQYKSW